MTNSFRKDVFVLLVISAVLTSFSAVSLGLHAFYPFNGGLILRPYLYLAIYLFTFSLIEIYLAIRLGKYKTSILCKIVGIYTFLFFPVLLLISTFLGFIVPKEMESWNFYMILVSFGVNIIYQSTMIYYISHRLIESNKGYVIIKSISWMNVGISVSLFLYYLSGYMKVPFVNVGASDVSQALLPGYYIISAIEITVMVVISLWILYVGYSCFLSGVVNNLVDLRHNVKFTRKVYQKYHVSFYIGIVGTFLMFIAALIASISFLQQYLSLMALYAAMLLIRIPVHYYDMHVDKKYKGNDKTIFIKKHMPLIYTGAILLLYAAVVILFGSSSQGKNLTNKSMLAILIIFVPYTLIRIAFSISKYRQYKKTYNPMILSSFNADVVMVLFTITNVIIMLGMTLNYYILIIMAMAITIGLVLYCIGIAIYLIVIGICGLRNKREKQYQKYLSTKDKDDSVISEE